MAQADLEPLAGEADRVVVREPMGLLVGMWRKRQDLRRESLHDDLLPSCTASDLGDTYVHNGEDDSEACVAGDPRPLPNVQRWIPVAYGG